MFENLTSKLSKVFAGLVSKKFTEDNIKDTLKEVKKALLEADVALMVVNKFITDLREDLLGLTIEKHLDPAQALVKAVNQRLVMLMSSDNAEINLKANPPIIILVAGLQGAGKTTAVAKLAKYIQEKHNKTVMVASCDIYRPAAIAQLQTLAATVGATFFPSNKDEEPINIATSAVNAAKRQFKDVLIIDTAGRLHIDKKMMDEVRSIYRAISPLETFFVVDGMTGQDAANTAKAFNDALALTGIIVTKLDGDTRGGAILSLSAVTGKPIKFIGVGEKVDALEQFYPDRIASRILGMGDILSLVEELESKIDKVQAEKMANKIMKGKKFDLEDFRQQLLQMNNMGGMENILDKLPGMGNIPTEARAKVNNKSMNKMLAVINSMTPKERKYPNIIQGKRKIRIADGSGTNAKAVNDLLKQFEQMQKMMEKLSKGGGLAKMMRSLPPGIMSKGMSGLPF